jgi:hypothetical protein
VIARPALCRRLTGRRLRATRYKRLGRHAVGQHQRDHPIIGPVVPDAVRGAQAVPQAVHDLILAQPGRLGDLGCRVCDQPINVQKVGTKRRS